MPAEPRPNRTLLRAADLDRPNLEGLLALAARLAEGPVQRQDRMLTGRSVAIAPGACPPATRVAVELAAQQLGAWTSVVPAAPPGPTEAALVAEVGDLVDLLALAAGEDGRGNARELPRSLGETARAPLLNLGSHTVDLPEALAALRTLQGPKATGWGRRKLVLAHTQNPLAGSPAAARTLLELSVTLGLGVTLHGPPDEVLPEDFLTAMQDRADMEGGLLVRTRDPTQAIAKADAVYPWCNIKDREESGRNVDNPWMQQPEGVHLLRRLAAGKPDPLAAARIPVCKAMLLHLLG